MFSDAPLITVIVPVYKVELYLERCLDSIVAQTYKNLEIILIDDGSPDNCGTICDEYAKKDKRIHVIHKENGGLSSARNAGLDILNGEYVSFVDSDDVISIDMIEYLYRLLIKNKADISVCLHKIIKEEREWISYKNVEECLVTPKQCITKLLYNNGVDTSAWAKLYKTKLFNDIRYPNGKIFEDIATTYKLFLKAKLIILGNKPKYNYIIRANSIISSPFDEKKFDLLNLTDAMGNEILNIYPDLYKAVLRRKVYARFSTLNQLADNKELNNKRDILINFIKTNSLILLKDTEVSFRDKAAIILLNISYTLYNFTWRKLIKK